MIQTDIAEPKILPMDSIHQITHTMLQQAVSDPQTFWSDMGQQAIHFGIKVLMALIIFALGYWMTRLVKKVLVGFFKRHHTERTIASFVISLVNIVLMTVLVIITISTLGIDTTSFAALLAAGGMAIGMALSGTVQNFAGGIMLLAFKPFKAGDFIEAQGYMGTVMSVSIVSTKILTTDNRVIILPNGTLFNGTINNFAAQPVRRVDIEVSVAYGSDPAKCIEALLSIIRSDSRILTSADKRPEIKSTSSVDTQHAPIPDPFVGLLKLNSNDITFVTRSWGLTENYWDVYFELQKRFYTELPQMGFQFAYPHCDVTIVKHND